MPAGGGTDSDAADVDSPLAKPPSECQSDSHDSVSSFCMRSSLMYSQGQDKILREEWAAPLLYESLSGPPSKALIYISQGQHQDTPYPTDAALHSRPAVVRRLPRRRLGVACLTLTAAVIPLLLLKMFLMGFHQFKHASHSLASAGQQLGGIQVIKRQRQHPDVNELSMDMESPRIHLHHPSVTPAPALLRIPRLIHQMYHSQIQHSGEPTYVSRKLAAGMPGQIVMGWRQHNGHAWEHRFYDDKASLSFVEAEYPEYLDAYLLLPHASERSDFFRYLVILKFGGVYADIDVECRKPLDSLLKPEDSLVVGWDVEVPSDLEAAERGLVRRRQLLQWFFAAAPQHPALREICDHVAQHIRTVLSADPHRDALERTGPGVWTDIILRHALQLPTSAKGAQWPVRILPRAVFAESPEGMDSLPAASPALVHHLSDTSSSWMDVHRMFYIQQWLGQRVTRLAGREDLTSTIAKEPLHDSGVAHFPVSVSFEPSFVMMVDLVGHGDVQAGADVSAAITNWGAWQAGAEPGVLRQPTVVEALVGSLTSRLVRAALVDVGAGQGLFSLAAAAAGHRAVSFEASAPSLSAFRASVLHNGFGALVEVHEVPLGARPGPACLRRKGAVGAADADDVHLRRGYGDPAVHGVRAEACEQLVQRTTLDELLLGSSSGSGVGSLRLSANGWEGWILQGAERWLRRQPPASILVEFSPLLIQQSGFQDPVQMLRQLHGLGYTHVAHAGRFCEERWRQLTPAAAAAAAEGGSLPAKHARQPTWCRLKPDAFHLMSNVTLPGASIENVLFIHSSHSRLAGKAVGSSADVGAAAAVVRAGL